MEDKEIIELYKLRSEDSIKQTDLKYGKLCRHISFNVLNNSQDSEECVNDSYLKLWNTIPPEVPNCFSAFLCKIVRNISLNKLKHRKTQKCGCGAYFVALEEIESILSSEMTEDYIDELHLRNLLNSFVADLSEESQLVFIGRYWHFNSISEISEKTGFSVSKTKMLLMRSRNDLKKYLEKEGVFI